MKTFAFFVAIFCVGVAMGASRADYLDLVEAAVSAYSADHIARYLEDAEKDGVDEHGFPRLAANLGILIANGRQGDKRDVFCRMMSISCRDAAKGTMKMGGNEFSVKELVMALVAVEKAGVFGKTTTDAWRKDLERIEADRCYSCRPEPGDTRAYNWCVYGCASEQARIAAGLGGDAAFVEKYVSDQLRWFDANGMYMDPGQPMVYDLVTRLQFMLLLHCGYSGQSRAKLEELLDRAAEPTLAMLSASGEIPFGGRSNQFLHNHTFYSAVCEWYAARYRAKGENAKAERFRRAASLSVEALSRWLAVRPVRHVKNLYPRGAGTRGSGMGCETYAYFNKYMVTMGSWASIALQFVDESVPEKGRPEKECAPFSFATSAEFHRLFLRAGEYSAQFDYAADAHYDCDGLGRLQRKGAPEAIFLSTPCAAKPNYLTEMPNRRSLAFMPACDGGLTPAGHGHDAKVAWADWKIGGLDWRCRLSADGFASELVGKGPLSMSLPAFAFDGERATEISCDGKRLTVRYKGWECAYETNGKIVATEDVCCNRNGRYRVFEAHGEHLLKVTATIRCDNR